MTGAWKVLMPAVLGAGMTAGAMTFAQPPGDRDDPPGERKDRRGGERPPPPGGERRDGRLAPGGRPDRADPAVEAWVKVLIEKITDPHDTVRDSARAGLVAVGPAAVPALQQLADGEDRAKATAARKLIAAIDRGPGEAAERGRADGPGAAAAGRRPGGDRDGPQPPQPGPGREGLPGRPAEGADRPPPLDRALGELNLTDKQKARVEEIKEAHQKKTRAVMEKARAGQIEREDIRGQMDKLSEEAAKELAEVLTPEQMKRLEGLMPPGRPYFPPPRPPGRGGPDGPGFPPPPGGPGGPPPGGDE